MRKLALLSATAACLAGLAGPAAAQATRTWVSGVGDDANPCSRTAPCKTFAGAISKTATAGEISVLDPGGFGAVTIVKSISINGKWGGEAGVLASLTTGVIVNAPADAVVNLRGLTIEGAGNGTNGIRYLAGGSLHVQDTVIRGFRGSSAGNNNGILVNPTAGNLVLDVTDTLVEDNGTAANGGSGISLKPTGAATVRASLTRVQASNNVVGLKVDGDLGTGAIDVIVRNSDFTRNMAEGISSLSPNNSDSLVRITVADSNSSNNTGIGIRSVGQQSTIRVGRSVATNNGGPGLQANNSGILQSYGDNMTEGNAAANIGVTPAPPS
jgi:hypothetical protein